MSVQGDGLATVGLLLLHLGWQAAFVASLLAILLRLSRDRSARLRYGLTWGAYALILLLTCSTAFRLLSHHQLPAKPLGITTTPAWVHLDPGASEMGAGFVGLGSLRADLERIGKAMSASVMDANASEGRGVGAGGVAGVGQVVASITPVLGIAWLLAVVIGALRLAWQSREARRLVATGRRPASAHLGRRFRALARRLGLEDRVALRESGSVTAPCVVGGRRATVLIPVGLDRELSQDMLDSLLVHELAHVRRRDIVAARLQSVADAVLWIHPAVVWISSRLRETREEACDETVVAAAVDPTTYARALFHLSEQSFTRPSVMTASTHGRLAERIERLLGVRRRRALGRPWLVAGVAAGSLVLGLMLSTSASESAASVWSPAPTAPHATWVWVTARGAIDIDLASTGIKAIEPGGWLRVDERRVDRVRSWMARPGSHGEIMVSYSVDGVDEPMDEESELRLLSALTIASRATATRFERLGETKQGWSHAHVGDVDAELVSIVHVGVSDTDPFHRLMEAALSRVRGRVVQDPGVGAAATGVPMAYAVQYALTLAHQLSAHGILAKSEVVQYVSAIERAVAEREE